MIDAVAVEIEAVDATTDVVAAADEIEMIDLDDATMTAAATAKT